MAVQSLFKYLLMFFPPIAMFITEAVMLSEKGDFYQNVARWKLATTSNSKQIIVSKQQGYGHYTTVQAAIDHGVPENNNKWIHIFVNAGYYNEQVSVPQNKPYIFMEGVQSEVFFNSSGIFNATFDVRASNFLAKNMIFKNQMNIVRGLVQDQARQRAVAVHVGGDKIAFIQCSFMSVQDTLFDDVGRHYFYNCRIEGYVDFIFGSGQSVYEGCHIITYLGDTDYSGPGYITAQRRNSRNDPNGFVFKHCTVEGNPKVYLGRAWGPYSRVVFFQSNLSNVIAPAGWVAWDYTGQEYKFTYGEMNCYGPGANRSERVKWEKHLTQQQVNDLLGNGFINTDGWLDQLPIKLPRP